MVAGLMGLRAAKPLAITAHRHLQGWSVGLGVCAGFITALGLSHLLCNSSMKGCLPSPWIPSQNAPSTRAGPAARDANPGEVQGNVSCAQPAAQHASPTLPGVQTPAVTGLQERSLSSRSLLPGILQLRRWASPGGPSHRTSPDLSVRAVHKQK